MLPTTSAPAAATASRAHVRGDIQGLRALSVLLVIAAHAGSSLLPGGYIGVDVFFVISGFLITSLLMREAERSGRVSLLGFYARRARRILPAATLVLVATCVASALFLPVVQTGEIFTDAVWAALFASNIRFAMVETDYFAADRPVSPLQHFWSLSVEEQFYVIWPLLLLLVVASLRYWPATAGVRRRAGVVLGTLVGASLLWSVWATHASPDTAYFSTLTRVWELGAGALLAVLGGRRGAALPAEGRPTVVTQGLALAGVAAIAVGAVVFDDHSPFPGVLAAVPVLGAVALILAGGNVGGQATLVGRVLAWRPAQVVGDWSYSLYLWHFPVLVIARAHWHGLSRPHLLVCLVVIFVLSGLTYHLVEEPFRRGRAWRLPWRAVVLYPVSVGLVVAGLGVANAVVDHRVERNAGNPAITIADYAQLQPDGDPARALVRASVLAAREGRPIPGSLVPDLRHVDQDKAPMGDCDYDRIDGHRLCPGGDVDADRTIVLVGDSHARAWSPALDAIGTGLGYRTYALAHTACPANQAHRLDPDTGRRWPECEDFVDWSVATVRDLRPDLVVISSAPLAPVVDPQTGEVVNRGGNGTEVERGVGLGLRQEIEALTPYAGRVVVLGDTPMLPHPPGECLSTAGSLADCLAKPLAGRQHLERSLLAVAREAGADVVDAQPWFCDRGHCPAVVGSFVPLRDREHLTTEYSEHLAPALAKALALSPGKAAAAP